jgi:glycosyltransferase involved in cell wall biosynthesis
MAPRIAILLATYEGARYLDAQLGSLAAQDVERMDVRIGDDGSTDATIPLLEAWRARWRKGSFDIVRGPGKGFAENFRALLLTPLPGADYVGYCDQDDVWDTDKLKVALGALQRMGEGPALYCARTRLVDAAGRPLGLSPLFSRPPSFRNALVQSIAGGNTMLLNRAAFKLVSEAAGRTTFVSHDWWSYQIVTGAGGSVHYDPAPHLDYRQHGGNLVGNNLSPRAQLTRLFMVLRGRFARWNDANLVALERCSDLLSKDARQAIAAFREVRAAPLRGRLAALRKAGLYRQTTLGDVALAAAAVLGKL